MNQKDESEVLDDLFGVSEGENDNINEQNDSNNIPSELSEHSESESSEEEIIEKKSRKNKKVDSNEEPIKELDGNN